MSYDLTVYSSKLGVPDPSEIEEIERELDNTIVSHPEMLRSEFNRNALPCAAVLNEIENKLPVTVDVMNEKYIELSFPFWYDEKEARGLFHEINVYLQKLAECGGYFIFDPQTGEAFDPKTTTFEWNNSYARGREIIKKYEQQNKPTAEETQKVGTRNLFLRSFWSHYWSGKTRKQKIETILYLALMVFFIISDIFFRN